MENLLLNTVSKHRLVPVAVIPQIQFALPLAEALLKAGLPLIEVTLRTPCAMEAMVAIQKEVPEMTVGAGTVLDPELPPKLAEAGLSFGVSPGSNAAVLDAAERCGFPMLPGVVTPSEVESALTRGLKLLKFFPAEAVGGAKLLKALAGPYAHTGVQFVPTGGIKASNARDYLDLPVTAAIGGSWFVDKAKIEAGDWEGIVDLTREAIKIAAQ